MIIPIITGGVLLGALFYYFDITARAKEYLNGQTHIYVIVHGSLFSELSLLSFPYVFHDTIADDSLYVSLAKKIRKSDYLPQDQTLLHEGWHQINPEIIERHNTHVWNEADKKKAAYFVIPALEQCAQDVEPQGTQRVYFTFGHLGLLSQRYRKSVAGQLYNHLYQTISYYKWRSRSVKVTIIAHSHGGNIGLYLPHHEDVEKKGVFVDTLFMYGTPIQAETASYAFSNMFGQVVNAYSEGDVIQGADRLSTKERACYKQFYADGIGMTKKDGGAQVYDMRLLVNNNPKRIDHVNMYFVGRSTPACRSLDPLPLMVHTPHISMVLDQIRSGGTYDCHINEDVHELRFAIAKKNVSDYLAISPNVIATSKECAAHVKTHWKPDDTSRSIIFNKKTGAILYEAFSSMEFR